MDQVTGVSLTSGPLRGGLTISTTGAGDMTLTGLASGQAHQAKMMIDDLSGRARQQNITVTVANAGPTLANLPGQPGWHADPYLRYEMRYWDGARWTEHVSSGGQQSADALRSDASSPTDQIRKLGELRESGLISDAEFEAKKTQLLDQI